MPTIAANTYRLPIADKLAKGQQIVTMSTDNPNVPGNDTAVARLAAAQAALGAANAAYGTILGEARTLLSARDTAVAEWNSAVNGLAAITEGITLGNPVKILSTGFDVRSPKTPTQRVETVTELLVTYNMKPGYSDLTWNPQSNATMYRVQSSPVPTDSAEWKDSGFSTEARFTTNGATPGQPLWYRVAAINSLGQGPWSGPASRPVM